MKNRLVMREFRVIVLSLFAPMILSLVSCEILDDDPEKHVQNQAYVGLDEVAELFASIPIQEDHLQEVYDAVSASILNGYDEEYTMSQLFDCPGSGVGDKAETRSNGKYQNPLKQLIEDHVRSMDPTRSYTWLPDPEQWLQELVKSDIQIYWPFSENWDGSTFPIITFDPEDDSDVNIGYKVTMSDDGVRQLEEVIVDESMASEVPVWVINRNSDASYKTLEMLKRENPEWDNGGGSLVVNPKADTRTTGLSHSLVLKDVRANRHYDCWFAGASEFFVKIGSLEDFTASTEAELKIYNPTITDFMIVVKRGQVNQTIPFDVILVSDWTEQLTHCALMIIEDDGGTWTEWKCTALVRVASKSYGVEISLPIRSWDDIVWRGRLAWNWLSANQGETSHFGDVDLTFEVVDYQ